jgi:hypothetical protein
VAYTYKPNSRLAPVQKRNRHANGPQLMHNSLLDSCRTGARAKDCSFATRSPVTYKRYLKFVRFLKRGFVIYLERRWSHVQNTLRMPVMLRNLTIGKVKNGEPCLAREHVVSRRLFYFIFEGLPGPGCRQYSVGSLPELAPRFRKSIKGNRSIWHS